jgi:hypothetical protein
MHEWLELIEARNVELNSKNNFSMETKRIADDRKTTRRLNPKQKAKKINETLK